MPQTGLLNLLMESGKRRQCGHWHGRDSLNRDAYVSTYVEQDRGS